MPQKIPLVLASASPRRRDLMELLQLEFEVCHSHVSEALASYTSPQQFVEVLARRKARAVAANLENKGSVVIGADTVVTIDGEILGKPSTAQEAANMLHKLQGRTHVVYTGLCVLNVEQNHERCGHSATDVTMKVLGDDQIHAYVATGEPFDKAGGYGIQGFGATFVTGIHGDYFTVVGMPLYLLADYLEQFGLRTF